MLKNGGVGLGVPDVSRYHVLGMVNCVSKEASQGSFLSEDMSTERVLGMRSGMNSELEDGSRWRG